MDLTGIERVPRACISFKHVRISKMTVCAWPKCSANPSETHRPCPHHTHTHSQHNKTEQVFTKKTNRTHIRGYSLDGSHDACLLTLRNTACQSSCCGSRAQSGESKENGCLWPVPRVQTFTLLYISLWSPTAVTEPPGRKSISKFCSVPSNLSDSSFNSAFCSVHN